MKRHIFNNKWYVEIFEQTSQDKKNTESWIKKTAVPIKDHGTRDTVSAISNGWKMSLTSLKKYYSSYPLPLGFNSKLIFVGPVVQQRMLFSALCAFKPIAYF